MISDQKSRKQQRKVLIAIGSAALFGAERRLLKIVKYLEAKKSDGLEICLVLNSRLYVPAVKVPWIGDLLSVLERQGRLVVFPDSPRHLGKARGLLRFIPLFFRAHVAHGVLRGRAVAYLRALFNLPSLVEITSPEIASRIGRGLPFFFLRRISFVCVSPSVHRRFLEEISRRGPVPLSEQLDVSCASIPFFDQPETPTNHTPPKEKWIVSASRFLERKNVVLLASALKDVLPDLVGWKAMILGQGPEEERLKAILSDEIARDQVVIGYEPKIADVLARSALYVSLIEPDSYPSQSVLEAMAFGNALLLGDVGDSARFLGDDLSNGYMTTIDRQAVSDAIRKATGDFATLLEMGDRSRRLVAEKFASHLYFSELLERYGVGEIMTADRSTSATAEHQTNCAPSHLP